MKCLFPFKSWQWLATVCLGWLTASAAQADLRVPAWYDQNAVNVAPDWHYRIPINVPAGATINSTIKVDVDFAALLTQLGISGTLDVNSPRVVRLSGALSTNQEFTDTVFGGVTDALGNGRGEVRFILQDAGAVTYYLYFDITANGTKPVNPQVPINGNFEQGGSGTSTPPGWNPPTKPAANAAADAQIRPSEFVSVSNTPNTADSPFNTNGTPKTGAFSYLMGYRSAATLAAGNPAVTFTKTITVPATSPGNLTVNWRPEGWDSSTNGSAANNFDTISIRVVGGSTTELVGSVTAQNYVTRPFTPNLGLNAASAAQSGYRQYNGYDCTTTGTHTAGMTVGCKSEPWWTYTASLAVFAGQTITLNFRFFSDGANDRTRFSLDDIEWSVVTATLGTPQAFGTNITLPAAASTFLGGQTLSIRAQMDAQPAAATANVYDEVGTLVASGIVLYNDGSHGDTTANDATWSNNGSVVANPTYTIPGGVPSGNNWLLRAFAPDASTSTIGAPNGLIHIPAQPNTPFSQANFFNVDELNFTVSTALLTNLKTVAVTSDPVNGGSNPKFIPGAEVLYTLNVTNSGPGSVSSNTLVIVDPIPANAELFTGNLSGGAPFVFVDGAPTSGLSCAFTALNNFADCVDFSNNGGVTWTYVPNGGFDSAVTHIRFSPAGSMNGDAVAGSPSPSFNLQFRVRVQ